MSQFDPDDDDIDTPLVEAVRCPCPPLEPYPAGWLSLPQWEFVAQAEYLFGTVKVDGPSAWVPWPAERVRRSAFGADALAAGCPLFETVFEAGCWIDLTPLGA